MTSAWSITERVKAPRAVFIDYPLGQTAGRAGDKQEQLSIIDKALEAIEKIDDPGTIVDSGLLWEDGSRWKDSVMKPETSEGKESPDDDRLPRSEAPVYQDQDDLLNAEKDCQTCVFFDES